MIMTEIRSSRDTTDVWVQIKNLNQTFKNYVLNGNEPIKILDFQTRFVNEANMLKMSVAQAFIALRTFLADPETHFRANLGGASHHVG